jgi:hypothetical protein
VDFSLVSLEDVRIPGIQAVIQILADAQTIYDIEPGRRFVVLRPAPAMLQKIKCATRFKDKVAVRTALLEGCDSPAAVDWSNHIEVPLTAWGCKQRLRNAIRRTPVNRDEIAAALAAAYRNRCSPMVQMLELRAQETIDPFKRAECLEVAQLFEDQFESDPDVVAAKQLLAGNMPTLHNVMDLKYIKIRLERHKAIRALRDELCN